MLRYFSNICFICIKYRMFRSSNSYWRDDKLFELRREQEQIQKEQEKSEGDLMGQEDKKI